jgi:hypothetical protein
VTKLNALGNALLFSTYLGGSNQDNGYDIAVNPANGDSFVTGSTLSPNFPKNGGFQTTKSTCTDAFVTKFNATGTRVFSSYLGGNGCDVGNAIAVDSFGSAFVTGETRSTNFRVTAGAFQTTNAGGMDAFVTKVKANGSGVDYSTYLGSASTTSAASPCIPREAPSRLHEFGQFPDHRRWCSRLRSPARMRSRRNSLDGKSLNYSTFPRQEGGFRLQHRCGRTGWRRVCHRANILVNSRPASRARTTAARDDRTGSTIFRTLNADRLTSRTASSELRRRLLDRSG